MTDTLTTTTACMFCKCDIPEFVLLRDEDGFANPPVCPTCTAAEDAYYAELEAEEERVRQHGGLQRCPSCSHYSVRSSDVCTLGYPGHPGAEFSVYRHCERESCEWSEL